MITEIYNRCRKPAERFERKNLRIINCKKLFQPKIKVTGYEDALEQFPLDQDPYDPENLDLCRSHYKTFGTYFNDEDRFLTTYNETNLNVFKPRRKLAPRQKYVSYYSFENDMDLGMEKERGDLFNPWKTTVQMSYPMPKLMILPRLKHELQNFEAKRIKTVSDPIEQDSHKFYDDGYQEVLCQFQKLKGPLRISYCPWLCKYMTREDYFHKKEEKTTEESENKNA